MRTHGFLGLAAMVAVMGAATPPAIAASAAGTTPARGQAPRSWGGVPNVTLQAPPHQGGWAPGGWQGGAPHGVAPSPGQPPMPMAGGMSHPGAPGMAPGGGPGRPGGWTGGTTGGHRSGGWHGGGTGGGYALRRGYRLPGTFLAPSYFISNWSAYGLGRPGLGYNWVRYYDGAALVDRYGVVEDYRDRVNWGDARGNGSAGGYNGGYADGYDDGFEDGADHVEDAVTYGGAWHRGGAHGGGYGAQGYGYHAGGYGYGPGAAQVYASGGATVVVVQGAPAVTTTTTTVEETVSYVAAHKRTWRKPVRVWRAKPRCVCTWR